MRPTYNITQSQPLPVEPQYSEYARFLELMDASSVEVSLFEFEFIKKNLGATEFNDREKRILNNMIHAYASDVGFVVQNS